MINEASLLLSGYSIPQKLSVRPTLVVDQPPNILTSLSVPMLILFSFVPFQVFLPNLNLRHAKLDMVFLSDA